MATLIIGAVLFALVVGTLLFSWFGETSTTISDALGIARAISWIGIGLAAIAGGFVFVGLVVIVLFTFLGLGRANRLTGGDVRSKING
jgi:hypothetical protein